MFLPQLNLFKVAIIPPGAGCRSTDFYHFNELNIDRFPMLLDQNQTWTIEPITIRRHSNEPITTNANSQRNQSQYSQKLNYTYQSGRTFT